jgi:hypothetical protein
MELPGAVSSSLQWIGPQTSRRIGSEGNEPFSPDLSF